MNDWEKSIAERTNCSAKERARETEKYECEWACTSIDEDRKVYVWTIKRVRKSEKAGGIETREAHATHRLYVCKAPLVYHHAIGSETESCVFWNKPFDQSADCCQSYVAAAACASLSASSARWIQFCVFTRPDNPRHVNSPPSTNS